MLPYIDDKFTKAEIAEFVAQNQTTLTGLSAFSPSMKKAEMIVLVNAAIDADRIATMQAEQAAASADEEAEAAMEEVADGVSYAAQKGRTLLYVLIILFLLYFLIV